MNIIDLSNRRGAIVRLLPSVYAILQRVGKTLPDLLIWTQIQNKAVVDINRRWVFALKGMREVMGFMLYRIDGSAIYIENLYGDHPAVVEALLKKFEHDDAAKASKDIYISRDIKKEAAAEVLESVGLQDDSVYNEDGYQKLGGLEDTVRKLKLRYMR